MENLTLTGLLKKAAFEFPTRRAISVSGKFDLSHARLQELVDHAASLLLGSGIHPGDVVALTFPNTVEFVVMFLAVIRCRAVAAPLNAAYTAEEFEFYLSDSESKLLITPREGIQAAQAAASKLKIPHVFATLTDGESRIALSTESTPESITELVNDPSDVALFLHTSGTTSRPKGVPLTQLNLGSSVRNIKSVYRLSESDSTVLVLPLFHVHGLIAGLLSSLISGAAATLPAAGRFSASTFWSDMRAYNATWYTAVPTIHQIILDRHLSKPEPSYPKLRFIRSCSASLAPIVLARLEESFGAPVLEAYAMTEASHQMASNPLPEDGGHKAGSVGRPAGQEMSVLDENGDPQKEGVSGEVCIRGPNVTKGYKNNPEANKTGFQFGWFHTGDIGFFDSDGYLHLVGRIKELINRGGEKISPIEVDAVLLSQPDVAQAVAFGVPDDKYGEEINCAIIPREGSNIDEGEVLQFCKKNLAAFKVPKKVFITDSLPKTATGKIQRRLCSRAFPCANLHRQSSQVGNAGVVVVAWGWASVSVGNAGNHQLRATAWDFFFFLFFPPPPPAESHGQPPFPERPTALFSDLDPPRPATTKERPTAWLSSQICDHLAICGGFWFRFARQKEVKRGAMANALQQSDESQIQVRELVSPEGVGTTVYQSPPRPHISKSIVSWPLPACAACLADPAKAIEKLVLLDWEGRIRN
uniref:4-coumarate--CoA ligase n=1 Tax=Fagus sylvatica TaxID=28930 RepID=A0A2N9IZW9_FAGSY